MQRLFFLGTLLLPVTAVGQQRLDRRFPIDADASVRITSPAGLVRVIGWDQDSIAIGGEIPTGAGLLYAGGRGKAAKLGIERSEESKAPGATLEVRVPRRARVWVKTVSAAVEVTGVRAEVDLNSVSGSLEVRDAAGVVRAETLDGGITAEVGEGIVRLHTGAGPIRARAASGDVTAVSVGGRVEVESPRLARGRLESVGGDVRFVGNLAPGAVLEAESHAGNVDLRFVGPVHAEFDLTAVAGVVKSALGSGPVGKGKPVRFIVGDGGADVIARTFKGTIVVTR
jgi:hypothetical protein